MILASQHLFHKNVSIVHWRPLLPLYALLRKEPMGRVRDAVRTLWGRSQPQIELARMRADFTDLMLDVSNAMEKLKTASLKFAKRDARAMGDALETRELEPPAAESNKWSRRAAVMGRRARPLPPRKESEDVRSDQAGEG